MCIKCFQLPFDGGQHKPNCLEFASYLKATRQKFNFGIELLRKTHLHKYIRIWIHALLLLNILPSKERMTPMSLLCHFPLFKNIRI